MPWELQLQPTPSPSATGDTAVTAGPPGPAAAAAAGSRWLRTKSGDIDQFAGLLAVDPTAGFGVWMATNGAADGAPRTLPDAIVAGLFPAISRALAAYDGWTLPRRAAEMVGLYTAYVWSVSSNMTANVTLQSRAAAGLGGSAGPPVLSCVFGWGTTAIPAILVAPDHDHDPDGHRPLQAASRAGSSSAVAATVRLPKGLPVSCLLATELAWDGEPMVFDLATRTMQVPGMLTAIFERTKAAAEQPTPPTSAW